MSIVRDNLMTRPGYTPYCGSELCKERHQRPLKGQRWPRTKFTGNQFKCPKCDWESEMDKEFTDTYKAKWSR